MNQTLAFSIKNKTIDSMEYLTEKFLVFLRKKAFAIRILNIFLKLCSSILYFFTEKELQF